MSEAKEDNGDSSNWMQDKLKPPHYVRVCNSEYEGGDNLMEIRHKSLNVAVWELQKSLQIWSK